MIDDTTTKTGADPIRDGEQKPPLDKAADFTKPRLAGAPTIGSSHGPSTPPAQPASPSPTPAPQQNPAPELKAPPPSTNPLGEKPPLAPLEIDSVASTNANSNPLRTVPPITELGREAPAAVAPKRETRESNPLVAGPASNSPSAPPLSPAPTLTPPAAPARTVYAGGQPVGIKAPPSAAPSADATSKPEQIPKPKDDITRVLQSVKLPERREVPRERPVTAPREPRVFDTMLGTPGRDESAPVAAAPTPVVSETPIAQSSLPNQLETAIPVSPQAPAAETVKEHPAVSSVRTLKDDLQEVVKDQKMSLVRAAALEEKKKEESGTADRPAEAAPHTARRVAIALVALLFLGAAGFFGVYYITESRGGAAPIASPEDSPLFYAERTIPLPLANFKGLELRRALAQALVIDIPTGSVIRIAPTLQESENTSSPRPATTPEFFQALETNVPEELVRTFRGDFFIGVYSGGRMAPVMVIPVTSYERAFASMLAWENSMNRDLAPFFGALAPSIDENGLFFEPPFQDKIIRNYDVRALVGDDESGILYSFPTRNILIMAGDPDVFLEVLSRLRASRQL